MGHTFSRILLHVIFSTKARRNSLYAGMRGDLLAYFGVFSVSESATDEVAAYIREQERHHRRLPFAEELRLLLEKHGVDYDPGHYLD